MTREELIKMMGDEDKAEYMMTLILQSIKPEFVMTILKLKKEKADKQYEDRMRNGYYAEGDKARKDIPEGWSLFGNEQDPEWQINKAKYDLWDRRHREQSVDKTNCNFFGNLYAYALWHKPEKE